MYGIIGIDEAGWIGKPGMTYPNDPAIAWRKPRLVFLSSSRAVGVVLGTNTRTWIVTETV